jgi:hypothetical protein
MSYKKRFKKPNNMKCLHVIKFEKLIDMKHVYDFLARLNIEYDHIRVEVVRERAFPFLEADVFSYSAKEK